MKTARMSGLLMLGWVLAQSPAAVAESGETERRARGGQTRTSRTKRSSDHRVQAEAARPALDAPSAPEASATVETEPTASEAPAGAPLPRPSPPRPPNEHPGLEAGRSSVPRLASPSGPSPLGAGLTAVLVLGGLVVFAFLRRRKSLDTDSELEVLARSTLSPKCQLILVRARDREFLLGVTDQGANLIGDWAPDEHNPAEVPEGYCPNPRPVRPVVTLSAGQPGPSLERLSSPRQTATSPAVRGLIELRRAKDDRAARWFREEPEIEA